MMEYEIIKRYNVKSPTGHFYYLRKKGSPISFAKCETKQRAEKEIAKLRESTATTGSEVKHG